MAKRRRRFKIKCSSLYALVVVLSLLLESSAGHYNHLTHHHKQHHKRHQQLAYQQHHNQPQNQHNHLHKSQQQFERQVRAFEPMATSQQQQQEISSEPMAFGGGSSSAAHLCKSVLPVQVARHLKLCKLIAQSPGANEALAHGASRAIAECRSQFKSERWNCTHSHGDHHLLTSELAQSIGNRESAFVQAIAAAAIVHSIATACSLGNLSDCACDRSRVGLIRRQEENWKWGGCSNNIKHGMLFAKHLVELLDAVHQHLRVRPHHEAQALLAARQAEQQARVDSQPVGQSQSSFCQRNHNITQAAHFQLIKSLLAKNSLEKHQEFRLAMNMHNNKIGRQAVARNMDFRCRCHGLSGSCSLKTCWLTLPNFQTIGAYLKRKYESSVHLPTAVNVNKLIPMMDRNEISAILSANGQYSPPSTYDEPATARTLSEPAAQPSAGGAQVAGNSAAALSSAHLLGSNLMLPEFAALVSESQRGHGNNNNNNNNTPTTINNQSQNYSSAATPTSGLPGSFPAVGQSAASLLLPAREALQSTHQTYYERHKQLQQISDEIPVNIAPMSQQQYQALLKDMKLCNNATIMTTTATPTYLTTRELHNHQQLLAGGKHIYKRKNNLNNNFQPQQQLYQQLHLNNGQLMNGQQLKNASQHLSQLLAHSNKDELIHLHKSPDYCEADMRHGFPGIKSRVCSDNPKAPDNCDKLCCGRGYTRHIYKEYYPCDCKFQFCCMIECANCTKVIQLPVCK